MDLQDFDGESLYFDEPIDPEVEKLLQQAGEEYGTPEAEEKLLKAKAMAPEHPLVLVALYRYFYYRHRLDESLEVANEALRITGQRLGLPVDWRELNKTHIAEGAKQSMTRVRFYLFALKGAGFLEMRLGRHQAALERLELLAMLDEKDRLGVNPLIEVAREALEGEA
jgi:tetratricopeptide (TPR) repeat protein